MYSTSRWDVIWESVRGQSLSLGVSYEAGPSIAAGPRGHANENDSAWEMGVGRGMPREMRSSQRTSSFPLNGKQEEASTLVLSGLRKEVEFMGQVEGGVGIPTRRRQVRSVGVPARGMGSQTRSQQSCSQPCISKWNGLSISTTTYLTSSMVKLVHEEAVNIRARLLTHYRSDLEGHSGLLS